MRVLGISGSLRRDSLNSALLRAAAERLPAGVELVAFERLREIPPYDEDVELAGDAGGGARSCATAMRDADAVLMATPEYNHSIPGELKNALDWASRPAGQSALNGKPAAAIGASTGMFGAVWAQAETRKVLGALGGRVVEAELPVGPRRRAATSTAGWSSRPSSPSSSEEILAELVAAAEAESRSRAARARDRDAGAPMDAKLAAVIRRAAGRRRRRRRSGPRRRR